MMSNEKLLSAYDIACMIDNDAVTGELVAILRELVLDEMCKVSTITLPSKPINPSVPEYPKPIVTYTHDGPHYGSLTTAGSINEDDLR